MLAQDALNSSQAENLSVTPTTPIAPLDFPDSTTAKTAPDSSASAPLVSWIENDSAEHIQILDAFTDKNLRRNDEKRIADVKKQRSFPAAAFGGEIMTDRTPIEQASPNLGRLHAMASPMSIGEPFAKIRRSFSYSRKRSKEDNIGESAERYLDEPKSAATPATTRSHHHHDFSALNKKLQRAKCFFTDEVDERIRFQNIHRNWWTQKFTDHSILEMSFVKFYQEKYFRSTCNGLGMITLSLLFKLLALVLSDVTPFPDESEEVFRWRKSTLRSYYSIAFVICSPLWVLGYATAVLGKIRASHLMSTPWFKYRFDVSTMGVLLGAIVITLGPGRYWGGADMLPELGVCTTMVVFPRIAKSKYIISVIQAPILLLIFVTVKLAPFPVEVTERVHKVDTPEFWMVILGLVFALILSLLHSRNHEMLVRKIFIENAQLEIQKSKMQKLLLRMLPPETVQRLLNDELVAEYFDQVCIMFVEIVGFAERTMAMDPQALVAILNMIFLTFDKITDRHKVFKVESIGQIYMVASGIPTPTHEHYLGIAQCALGMLAASKKMKWPNGTQVEIKIGIHAGSCVAGVIGSSLPRYRLFGDTVNTASRMCSSCAPGSIQVSIDAERLLHMDFNFNQNSVKWVKGKGWMKSFELLDKKSAKRQVASAFPAPLPVQHHSDSDMESESSYDSRGSLSSITKIFRNISQLAAGRKGHHLSVSVPASATSVHQQQPNFPDVAAVATVSMSMHSKSSPSLLQRSSTQGSSMPPPLSLPSPSPNAASGWYSSGSDASASRESIDESGSSEDACFGRTDELKLLGRGRYSNAPPLKELQSTAETKIEETGTIPNPIKVDIPNEMSIEVEDSKNAPSISRFKNRREKRIMHIDIPEPKSTTAIAPTLAMNGTCSTIGLRTTSPLTSPLQYGEAWPSINADRFDPVLNEIIPSTFTNEIERLQNHITGNIKLKNLRQKYWLYRIHRICRDTQVMVSVAAAVVMLFLFIVHISCLVLMEGSTKIWISLLLCLFISGSCILVARVRFPYINSHRISLYACCCMTALSIMVVIPSFLLPDSFYVMNWAHTVVFICVVTYGNIELVHAVVICIVASAANTLTCLTLSLQPPFANLAIISVAVIIINHDNSTDELQNFVLRHRLREERARKKKIIGNLLPSAVSKALMSKEGPQTASQLHESVSLLFADIVNFTALSAQISPESLVQMLKTLFDMFDEVAARLGVYKVETIGDCYFGCTNAAVKRVDHAVALATMALLVQARVKKFLDPLGNPIRFRIGLHTGPVVAGVVGYKMPRYHLFGPSILKASKAESAGVGGFVNVTRPFKEAFLQQATEDQKREVVFITRPDEDHHWMMTKAQLQSIRKQQTMKKTAIADNNSNIQTETIEINRNSV